MILRTFLASLVLVSVSASAAVGKPADKPAKDDEGYQHLAAAASSVVAVRTRALSDARSAETLGTERSGSGILLAPNGLVLTIGYLILEADSVEVTASNGRAVPATVVAYDHATGFGLLRPIVPLDVKGIRLGKSASVAALDRLMIASALGESVSIATVVSRRRFAGYWEYLIDDAIFTSPPRLDHSGAALINQEGELVGIGSLLVLDAATPGERLPGNMFVPVDLLKPILDEMIATGRQKGGIRPWLGLSSLEDDGAIRVLRVSSEGPADRAGIRPGDVILAVSGQKVDKLVDFYRRLWAAGAPGVEVTLRVRQAGEVRDVKLRTIDRIEYARKKPTI